MASLGKGHCTRYANWVMVAQACLKCMGGGDLFN